MTDEERVEQVVYRSPLKLTPKRRLARTIEGLLYAVQQECPGLSAEESRMWVGLVLTQSRSQLITEASQTGWPVR